MNINIFEGLDKLFKSLSKNHLIVHEVCTAEMNNKKGFLGISTGLYTRVWFDTEEDSVTLFTSFSKDEALDKFEELKEKYGK